MSFFIPAERMDNRGRRGNDKVNEKVWQRQRVNSISLQSRSARTSRVGEGEGLFPKEGVCPSAKRRQKIILQSSHTQARHIKKTIYYSSQKRGMTS
jgi:hypothetical protein